QIDWRSSDMPKLWRYNLHYFDYLMCGDIPENYRLFLIEDWIRSNPVGCKDAWEPYTISLRIVNWIKFYICHCDEPPCPEVARSLYMQAIWLEKNLEYHILANHYLKNGVALLFAGCFFCGRDADRWIKKGKKIVESQAEEQFLGDGGH